MLHILQATISELEERYDAQSAEVRSEIRKAREEVGKHERASLEAAAESESLQVRRCVANVCKALWKVTQRTLSLVIVFAHQH